MRYRWIPALLLLAIAFTSAACQKMQEPVPSLTQDQWRRVQENLLEAEPSDVMHPVDAVFDEKFRLIGWDISPERVEVGQEFTLTFYWEVLEETNQRWGIFVHLDAATRQNIDHEAIGGIYPTPYWERGQIIRDEFTATLSTGMGDGDVAVLTGFWRDDARLPVSREGGATEEEDGRLNIGTFSAQWQAPEYRIRRANGTITIDGNLDEPAWRRAEQTDAWVNPNDGSPVDLTSWAKVLWDDENLYVGLFAEDPDVFASITERDGDLWDEEVLEVYIDGMSNGRDYLEFQINPVGTVFDAFFAQHVDRDLPRARAQNIAGLETAVSVDGTVDNRDDRDRSWTAELKIPMASLPSFIDLPPSNGDTIRLNFYRYDRSNDDPTRYLAWSPVGGGSFHQPDRFGIGRFQGAPARRPAAPQEGSGDAASPTLRRGALQQGPPVRPR